MRTATPVARVAKPKRFKPLLIVVAVLACLVILPIAPGFVVGFTRGFLGLPPAGETQARPAVSTSQPPSASASPTVGVPAPIPASDGPADETYVLPRIKKSGPSIDTDYVESMERAAAALTTHYDCGPLDTPDKWHITASVLWSDVPTLKGLSRTGPSAQRARYKKWANDLEHLCHLVHSESDDPSLQHYRVRIVYTPDDKAQ